ncbi:MAG: PDZ domain-containing protein, partial [Candidatus Eisenbacteria bacterium]|nr:PDZ domain-containing protein [Candidatus Eisenbacteria bacterium]
VLRRILPSAPQGSPAHLEVEASNPDRVCGGLLLDGAGVFFGMVVDCGVEGDVGSGTRDAVSLPRDDLVRGLSRGKILQIASRLEEEARTSGGFLGVQAEQMSLATADAGSIEFPEAPVGIVRVLADSPADLAGILPGDRILALNGRPVTTVDDVSEWIGRTHPGDAVVLSLLRNGESVAVEARIADRSMLTWLERRATRRAMARKQIQRQIDVLQEDLDRLRPASGP